MTPTLIIVTLIVFGILALLAEFLLIPGIGICGIIGLGSIIYSAVYAFHVMGNTIGTIVVAVDIAIIVLTVVFMLREKTWKRFELKEEIKSSVEDDSVLLHVGQRGRSLTRLAPMGTVAFQNVTCEAKSSDNTLIDPSTEVEVVKLEGNQVYVKPINNKN